MNEFERGDLLIQIKEKLDNLIKAFDRVSNGTGFPRCVEREQRIKRLEQDVIALKEVEEDIFGLKQLSADVDEIKEKRARFDTWLMRTTWIVIIAGIVNFAFF